MTNTLIIPTERASIVSATLYNNSVEVCRRVKHVITTDDLVNGSVIDFRIDFKKQQVAHESVRVQDATGTATILEVATGQTDSTRTSIIEEYPEAKKLFELLFSKLKEKRRHESQLVEAEDCKNTLRALRLNVVDARAGPLTGLPNLDSVASTNLVKKIVDLSTSVTDEIHRIEKKRFETQLVLRTLGEECRNIRDELCRICGAIPLSIDRPAADTLKDAADQLVGCRLERTHHVVVKCNVNEAGPIEFTVVYTVHNASWGPAYDLRASTSDLTNAELTYYGLVSQSTTEHWRDIDLILSTGSPSLAGHPKELPALKVAFPTPRQSRLFGASVGRPMSVQDSDDCDMGFSLVNDEQPSPPLMGMAMMIAKSETTSHATFSLPGHYSVPSDGEAHKLAIMQKKLDTTIYYYAFPEADQTVYRAAMFKNTSDYYLLPSEAVSIFWDNSFVAKTKLPAVPPGAEFQTYLGREMQVQVEIQPLRKYRKTAGSMFTGGTTDKEGYEHAGWVQNLRKHPIVLMTAFRLPRSSDETIKIQMDTAQGKHVTVSCRTDLEVFSHPDVPKLDARNPTVIVVNEPTDHCVILKYLESGQKSKVNCSYFIERPANKKIEIN